MFPRSEVIELSMSVDQALKYVVSMGVVSPTDNHNESGDARGAKVALNR